MMDCGIVATGVFTVLFVGIWALTRPTNHALVWPELAVLRAGR